MNPNKPDSEVMMAFDSLKLDWKVGKAFRHSEW
jgi:hypothetical protein